MNLESLQSLCRYTNAQTLLAQDKAKNSASVLVWLRRDLRLDDLLCLTKAHRSGLPVYVLFVLESRILDALPREDRRVSFILKSLKSLQAILRQKGSDLLCIHGDSVDIIPSICKSLNIRAVYASEDYEKSSIERDQEVAKKLIAQGCILDLSQDHLLMPPREVLTQGGSFFTVYSAYAKKWLETCRWSHLDAHPIEKESYAFWRGSDCPREEDIGFKETLLPQALGFDTQNAKKLFEFFLAKKIQSYKDKRDYPALGAGSYLGVHNRFGTLSVRYLVRRTLEAYRGETYQKISSTAHSPKDVFPDKQGGAGVWLSEIVWRDFYFYILHAFPRVQSEPFVSKYKTLAWENNPKYIDAWKSAQTGYPIVDAAIKQLVSTGYMHNRLRMICASFFTKHLLCDYKIGEAFFAEHLLDFDLSANNGGWQWSASTGIDAQPYFRIFNPMTQSEKFDPEGLFIKRWLPRLSKVPAKYVHAPWLMSSSEQVEFGCVIGVDYPLPIVNHAVARERALEFFKLY